MTRAEINIIRNLKDYPAERPLGVGCNYNIGSYRTTGAMLIKMRKKGLLKMGVHHYLPGKHTFIVNLDNEEVKGFLKKY